MPYTGTMLCPTNGTPSADGRTCDCFSSGEACGAAAACAGNLTCYWTAPAPTTHGSDATNVWKLLDMERALFCLPQPPSVSGVDGPVWWNGGVLARTHCDDDGTRCGAGDCTTDADANCPPGGGGRGAVTLSEVTMQSNEPDYYDVSIINGANVAIVVAPVGTPQPTIPAGQDPRYWCGNPGSANPITGAAACDWVIDPGTIPVTPTPAPPNDYRTTFLSTFDEKCSVTADGNGCVQPCSASTPCPTPLSCEDGYCQCDSDSDCPPEQLCGTQRAAGWDRGLQRLCGRFVGWWTANDICSRWVGFGETEPYGPLDCSAEIPNGAQPTPPTPTPPPTTLNELLQCIGANAASCYNTFPGDTTCCGCATESAADGWPTPSAGAACSGDNTTWHSAVQPLLGYLKTACPTAYTYPYDDPTSTFQCATADTDNMMGYRITFLPLPTPARAATPP
jgi:hypothetical protein